MEIRTAAKDQKYLPDTPLSWGYIRNVPDINNFVRVMGVYEKKQNLGYLYGIYGPHYYKGY
jgi:hypothetical protein